MFRVVDAKPEWIEDRKQAIPNVGFKIRFVEVQREPNADDFIVDGITKDVAFRCIIPSETR